MIRDKIFLITLSLALVYLTAFLSYRYAIRSTSSPQARAHSSNWSPAIFTRPELDEYRMYLMSVEDSETYMYWDEWKLSKVFKKTLTQLELPLEGD